MNQPTEDRIKRLEEEQRQLKEKVRKLEEQQTEPIRIDRLEIDRGGTHKRLDAVQEDTNVLKIEMQGARADIRVVKANQSDARGYLENHSQRLESIEQKQDAHSELLGQLITIGEEAKTTMATKDDVSRLEAIMVQMMNRLPRPEGE
jgi:chromosome segregation ATPase